MLLALELFSLPVAVLREHQDVRFYGTALQSSDGNNLLIWEER